MLEVDLNARQQRLGLMVELVCVATFLLIILLPWASFIQGGFNLAHTLAGPSLAHPLGTDNMGRDLLLRLSEAVRGAVLPIWFSVIGASIFGAGLAFLSILAQARQAFRPLVMITQATFTLLASVPVGLFAFTLAVYMEKAGTLAVILALSLLFAVRSFLEIWDLYRHDCKLGYWVAHHALGGRAGTRLWRYGLCGGWLAPLGSSLSFHLKAAVAIEASLSYLGFGVQEPAASFGNMLASHFDLFLKGEFFVLIVILAVFTLTAAFPQALSRIFIILPSWRIYRQQESQSTFAASPLPLP